MPPVDISVETSPEQETTPAGAAAQLMRDLASAHGRIRDLEARLDQADLEAAADAVSRAERLRLLLGNLQELILVVDPNRVITDVAGNCMGLIGYSALELCGSGMELDVVQLFDEHDRPSVKAQLAEAKLRPQGSSTEVRVLDRAGEARWVECTLVPLYGDTEHQMTGVQVILRDISDRVRAEQMMRSLNEAAAAVQKASLSLDDVLEVVTEQLRALDLSSGVGLLSPDASELDWVKIRGDSRCMQAMEKLVAAAPGLSLERVPEAWQTLQHGQPAMFSLDRAVMAQTDIPEAARRQIAQLMGPTMLIIAPLRAEAHSLGFLAVGSSWLDEESIPAIQAYANQTAIAIHNSRLVGRLADSETQYRAIFESARDGMLVTDEQGRVVAASETTCQLFGIEHSSMIGTSIECLFSLTVGDIAACCEEGVNSGEGQAVRAQARRASGEAFPVELRGSRLRHGDAVSLMVLITDISERIRAQEALVQSERLSALGQMAGGIAHDFNNILVSILGYAQMASQDASCDPERLVEDLAQIEAGARDAADAVSRLQSLYRDRDDRSDFIPIQLDDVLLDVLALNRPRWKDIPQLQGITYHIETRLRRPDPVLGNGSELRRVLSNLLINAIDAMPRGGTLAFESEQLDGYGSISISDTGGGIQPEIQPRIFEPFFTTKKSSGLGLTVCANIVKRHNGTMHVESQPGLGTRIIVRLPTVMLESPVATQSDAIVDDTLPIPALSILVIDDEPHVRQVLTRVLQRQGHRAHSVSCGQDGLAILSEQEYDLLICDLGMPEMPGSVVMQRAHALRPGMPIILATGWGDSVTPDQLRQMRACALLPKPFGQEDVERAIAAAIKAGAVP